MNASFKEMGLPVIWKAANVFPLHKLMPLESATKNVRPIYLTTFFSKVAEEFLVQEYVNPVILEILGLN